MDNGAVTSTSERASRQGTRVLAWLVLAAAIGEVVAPVITINGPGASPGTGAGPELLITPVGWAFAIWGVIYALAIIQAVTVLVIGAEAVPRRLQIDQLVLYVGGAIWIFLAALDSSLATAAALLVMFVAALDGVLTARRHRVRPRFLSVATTSAIGLYAGWVTAAFFLNVSTALVDVGLVEADQLAWQLAILVVAVVTLAVITVAARGVLAYTAAGCWALAGIAVTGASDGTTAVIALTVASAVLLVLLTGVVRWRGRDLPLVPA